MKWTDSTIGTRWVPLLVTAAVLAWHGSLCWEMIGGRAGVETPYPFVTDDHSFNYYYAVLTRDFLRQHASTAGYDPHFMAGYAKSILFPSSSTLAEVVVFLAGGERPERVYKLYVAVAAFLSPLLVWLAARIWWRHAGKPVPVIAFYLWYFWFGVGSYYVYVGMVPFVLGATLALLATALFFRWLSHHPLVPDRWSRLQGIVWWALWVFVGAAAPLVHLTTPIVCAPAWLTMVTQKGRWKQPAWVASFLVGLVLMAVANAFWLLPGLLLWETKGRTDSGFINPNVLERFWELARGDFPWELAILVLIPVGLLVWRREERGADLGMAVVLGWTFFLGYLAGWIRQLDVLQPGRYTLYFFTFGSLPAGLVVWRVWRLVMDWLKRWRLAGVSGVALAGVAALLFPTTWHSLDPILRSLPPRLHATLPGYLEEVIREIKRQTKPGDRILFEERNRGAFLNGRQLVDPFGPIRLSPLVPLLTNREVVGGPYLYTHLKTNFSQVGDGRLFKKEGWDAERFEKYVDAYDLDWIVCWSPAARRFCTSHPKLVEVVKVLGPPPAPILLGRILRQKRGAVVGSASIQASSGRIDVRDARPENGVLVLPYHWTPLLKSDPPLKIVPFAVGEDPVGLIQVTDPPPQFSLWLDPWGR
ncbi:MAG: hypothetical protein U1D30_23140 [Planctomycetota bacterium]